jgi:hypothetical protein
MTWQQAGDAIGIMGYSAICAVLSFVLSNDHSVSNATITFVSCAFLCRQFLRFHPGPIVANF